MKIENWKLKISGLVFLCALCVFARESSSADAYKKLYQGQLPASATTLYTVPGSTSAIIKHIVVVNTTAGDLTFQLFRNGTTAAYAITPSGWTVPANGKLEWDGTMALNTGETIAGVAGSATSLNIIIDGDEVS